MPGDGILAMAALAVGPVTFGVRIWLPAGWTFAPLNFQVPHFLPYIAMFALGIVAYRRGWLDGLSDARGQRWGRIVVVFLLVLAPILFVAGARPTGTPIPSAAASTALLCVPVCILIAEGIRRLPRTRRVL